MVDFREYKQAVKEQVTEINKKRCGSFPWKAKVLKNEVRLSNEYFDYIEARQPYFTIKFVGDEAEPLTWGIFGYNTLGQRFTIRCIGLDRWSDGTTESCIRMAIDDAESHFGNCY